jgi:acetyltransferase-like isoleucine patch superfamily enzyme
VPDIIPLLKRWTRRVRMETTTASEVELDSTCLVMGQHTYGRPQVLRYRGDLNKVVIGNYCSIADEVTIFVGGNHRTDWVSTFPIRTCFNLPGKNQDGHPLSKGDVIVGSDVWLGFGATILSGVRIGDGAVVGARSVVSADVPPYGIVVGNPARLVRMRFTEAQIEELLHVAWWNWPAEKVVECVGLLNGASVDDFIGFAKTCVLTQARSAEAARLSEGK